MALFTVKAKGEGGSGKEKSVKRRLVFFFFSFPGRDTERVPIR
jgi:hypothetical protein